MKGRVLLFDETATHRRAALVEDGRLEALEIDRIDDPTPRLGSIYRAKVETRLPALGAAFVDLGGQPGFLPEAGIAQPGDTLLVQIRREPEGDKAARVAVEPQYQGRFLVHTPDKPGINVSRKIGDADERAALRNALEDFAPKGGFVIRTAAAGVSVDVLEDEARRLVAQAKAVFENRQLGCAREGPGAYERMLLAVDVDSATQEASPAAHDALADHAVAHRITAVDAPFDHHDIDAQIDALLHPRVELPDGAWLTIESTAALIAIDVNTGASRSGDATQRANIAASDALPRECLLRRIGGTLAIDFAGGPTGKARKRLEEKLAISDLSVLGWGPAGWLECRRRKPGRSLADIIGQAR